MENYSRYSMTIQEKMDICMKFFEKLAEMLNEEYEVVRSCNRDQSAYLIPKGTKDQLSYYGKPVGSFRISDHWNWFSSLKRCKDPKEVQCRSIDMFWCQKRDPENPKEATKPRIGVQVAVYGNDKAYHCVFGEKFDRETKKWSWMDSTPEDAINEMRKCFK